MIQALLLRTASSGERLGLPAAVARLALRTASGRRHCSSGAAQTQEQAAGGRDSHLSRLPLRLSPPRSPAAASAAQETAGNEALLPPDRPQLDPAHPASPDSWHTCEHNSLPVDPADAEASSSTGSLTGQPVRERRGQTSSAESPVADSLAQLRKAARQPRPTAQLQQPAGPAQQSEEAALRGFVSRTRAGGRHLRIRRTLAERLAVQPEVRTALRFHGERVCCAPGGWSAELCLTSTALYPVRLGPYQRALVHKPLPAAKLEDCSLHPGAAGTPGRQHAQRCALCAARLPLYPLCPLSCPRCGLQQGETELGAGFRQLLRAAKSKRLSTGAFVARVHALLKDEHPHASAADVAQGRPRLRSPAVRLRSPAVQLLLQPTTAPDSFRTRCSSGNMQMLCAQVGHAQDGAAAALSSGLARSRARAAEGRAVRAGWACLSRAGGSCFPIRQLLEAGNLKLLLLAQGVSRPPCPASLASARPALCLSGSSLDEASAAGCPQPLSPAPPSRLVAASSTP